MVEKIIHPKWGTNWRKREQHSNYGKAETAAGIKYYKPLIDWLKYNYLKVAMRELQEKDLSSSSTNINLEESQ